ncbi:MAG: DUF4179 domain-containing protein [Rubrobacteraceae bacterium]
MNRYERISKVLRGYAEMRVPGAADPWPEIKESIGGDSAVAGPRSSRRFRLVPRTRAGLVFAVLLMMLFGTVGFAATGWIDELFQYTAPEIGEANLGVQLNEKQTVDGITFTLERAYADEDNVVTGYSISGFDNRTDVWPTSGAPMIADGSNRTFEYGGGLGVVTDPYDESINEAGSSDLAFFEPSEKLDPSSEHGFRFELELNPKAGEGGGQDDLPYPGQPRLQLRDSVNKIDVIKVGQTREERIPMTLERWRTRQDRSDTLLRSPAGREVPWAVIERPDIGSDVFGNDSLYNARPDERPCVGTICSGPYDQPGNHSLTVTQLEGRSPLTTTPV